MYLCKARITEICAFLMCFPGCSNITSHCICAQIKHIAVSTAAYQHRMPEVSFKFTGYKIPGNNTTGLPVYHNNIQHFMPAVHSNISQRNLPFQCTVSSEQ